MAFAETANLAVKLTLGGNFTSQMAKAKASLRGLDRDASRGYRAGTQIGTGIKRTAIIAAGGFTVLAGAIIKSVGAAGDFEAQLNTINTIAFKNAAGLKAIGDGIRDIAKKSGLSLDDLTASYYDLLSAGIKTADAQAVLNDAVTLGIGGLSTTAEAVDLLTTAYNAYGLNAAGAAKATDMFAQAVADGKVKASEIAATFANVASIAKAYHIGIDQIAASYGFLTAQGVPAAEVTTEMNRAIISLIKPSKALARAQKILGVNFTTVLQKKGLVPALDILRKYSDKTGVPLIQLLGRVEAVKYALQTTGPNARGFAAELERIRHSSGEAAKQMAEREQGLNFQIGRLKALAKDAGITIGSALLPKLTPAVEAINKLINDSQPQIAAFGQTLADSFSTQGVIDGIKALADGFGQMVALAKIAAEPVKTIVNAFLALPKGVQTALVAAFAVNKLTGGLVTNLAGGLVEQLGRSLGIIKSPLVRVQGGVVQVSGGVPGGGGGAVPVASKGIGALGKVFLIGEAIGLVAAVNDVYQAVNADSTAHAQAIQDQTTKFIQSQPSQTALISAVDAVDTGIRDLQSNPLNVLVQGDALTKLTQMRDSLNAAIGPGGAGKAKDDLSAVTNAVNANKAAIEAASAGQVLGLAANALVAATATGSAATKVSGATSAAATKAAEATNAGASSVAAAVRAIPAPITNVNVQVHVTPAQVTKTIVVTKRYGPPNGSYGNDTGHGQLP